MYERMSIGRRNKMSGEKCHIHAPAEFNSGRGVSGNGTIGMGSDESLRRILSGDCKGIKYRSGVTMLEMMMLPDKFEDWAEVKELCRTQRFYI